MHPFLRCMCTCSTPCRLWHSVHQRERLKLMCSDSAIIASTNWPSTELLLKGTWLSLWPAKDISQFVDRIIIGHSRIPWPVSGNSKTKIKIITSEMNTMKIHDNWQVTSIVFGKTVKLGSITQSLNVSQDWLNLGIERTGGCWST